MCTSKVGFRGLSALKVGIKDPWVVVVVVAVVVVVTGEGGGGGVVCVCSGGDGCGDGVMTK